MTLHPQLHGGLHQCLFLSVMPGKLLLLLSALLWCVNADIILRGTHDQRINRQATTMRRRSRVLLGDFHDPIPPIQHPVCLYEESFEPQPCYFNNYYLPNVVPYSSVETLAGRLYWQWTKLGYSCEGAIHHSKCLDHKSRACIWSTGGCGVRFSVEQYFVLNLADKASWGYKATRCSADGLDERACSALPHCKWVLDTFSSCTFKYDIIPDPQFRAVVQTVVEKGASSLEDYSAVYNSGRVTEAMQAVFNVQACFHASEQSTCEALKYVRNGQPQQLCEWAAYSNDTIASGSDADDGPQGSCMYGGEGYLAAYFGHDLAITTEWQLWNKKCNKYSKADNATACFIAFTKYDTLLAT